MKLKWSAAALMLVSTSAVAIEMNMEYVQNSNAVDAGYPDPSLRSEALHRTITGGSGWAVNALESVGWSLRLQEQLTVEYSALSRANVGVGAYYSWQKDLAVRAPGYRFSTDLDYTFAGNAIYLGATLTTTASRVQMVTDRTQWQAAVTLTNEWRQYDDLNQHFLRAGSGLDYRVTSNLYLYGFASVEAGLKNKQSTGSEQDSTVNRLLSQQLNENWFVRTGDALTGDVLLGANMPFAEQLSLDVAAKWQGGWIAGQWFNTQINYISILFRF